MNEAGFYVYVLTDPRSFDRPFYVGKGKGGRWSKHFMETYQNTINRKKWCKMAAIKNSKHDVGAAILESGLTEEQAYQIETMLIILFGRDGIENGGILTNICLDSRPPSPLGRKMSTETRKRIGDKNRIALTGRKIGPYSEAHRKAISLGLLNAGIVVSEDRKRRQAEKLRGRKNGELSAERKRKISEANRGTKNGMYGKKHSDGVRSKITQNSRIRAERFRKEIEPHIQRAQLIGITRPVDLMKYLNENRVHTNNGKKWTPSAMTYYFKGRSAA